MLRTFNVLSVHLDSSQMAQTGKRTIVHCPRGIPRHSEVLRGIYSCFPSVDSSGLSAEVTNLGEGYIYIYRAMELKLNRIALNRSRDHAEDK